MGHAKYAFAMLAFCAFQSGAEAQTLTLEGNEMCQDENAFSAKPNELRGSYYYFEARAWTWYAQNLGPGVTRSFFACDLPELLRDTEIVRAVLYLSQDRSVAKSNPVAQHSTLSGSNAVVVQRTVSPWSAEGISWNTQPVTTQNHQVMVPASTNAIQDYQIDVTALLNDALADGETRLGLAMKLVTERHYRAVVFSSSDNVDPESRPRLVVTYEVAGRERAELRSVGDVNGDGTPEIAVVARNHGKTIAKVKDAANGGLISQFKVSANLLPVDVEVMDSFGTGPSLVLLLDSGEAETRDLLTGDLLGSVTFTPKLAPVGLTVLPDQDGNGIPELGMLGRGSTTVEVRDALTGNSVNDLWFAESFEPRQVITLPDLNNNGSAEVGVVLTKAGDTDRIVVKDTLSDEKLETVGTWWKGEFELLQALPVTDQDGNGTSEVAMLLHDPATGTTLVRVADAASNKTAAAVRGYNPNHVSVKLAQVADFNGNGLKEYALLARNPDTGQVTADVRDASGAVSRMSFSSECIPIDLATIADINDNGAQELVMLGRCGPDGALKAVVKDAKTGETLNQLTF